MRNSGQIFSSLYLFGFCAVVFPVFTTYLAFYFIHRSSSFFHPFCAVSPSSPQRLCILIPHNPHPSIGVRDLHWKFSTNQFIIQLPLMLFHPPHPSYSPLMQRWALTLPYFHHIFFGRDIRPSL